MEPNSLRLTLMINNLKMNKSETDLGSLCLIDPSELFCLACQSFPSMLASFQLEDPRCFIIISIRSTGSSPHSYFCWRPTAIKFKLERKLFQSSAACQV